MDKSQIGKESGAFKIKDDGTIERIDESGVGLDEYERQVLQWIETEDGEVPVPDIPDDVKIGLAKSTKNFEIWGYLATEVVVDGCGDTSNGVWNKLLTALGENSNFTYKQKIKKVKEIEKFIRKIKRKALIGF